MVSLGNKKMIGSNMLTLLFFFPTTKPLRFFEGIGAESARASRQNVIPLQFLWHFDAATFSGADKVLTSKMEAQ
jgi:hypothetical protein